MVTATESRRPDIAVVIAGVIAIAALIAWVALWLTPAPDDELAQAARDTKAQAELATQGPPVAAPGVNTQVIPAPPAPPDTPSPTPAQTLQQPTDRGAPEKSRQKKADEPPKASVKAGAPEGAPKPTVTAAPKPPATNAALEKLRGRYVGTLISGSETLGLTLEIHDVANGVVSGLATLGGQACRGRYPVQGSYKGDKLHMRAPRNGGPAGDCPLGFVLGFEGEKLVGTSDGGDRISLRK